MNNKWEPSYRIDLANTVVPADQGMDETRKMTHRIARKSPLALREANNAMNMDIKSGFGAELFGWSMLFSSQDQKEGMNSFLENRKAEFHGK
ncbi:MAG: enoyl-CoA hydratase-related protein [Bacillota bacterium]|nr:enoyl-CoA hydratase-related protein [Bacillota bacterium]